MQDLQALSYRITRVTHSSAATCMDYAHWDETYQQIDHPDKRWIYNNLYTGLVDSFKFDVMILQDSSGKIVWQHGLDNRIIHDIGRYQLLNNCTHRKESSGIIKLADNTYSYAVMSVVKSTSASTPNGMLLVARHVNQKFLADLAEGTDHRIMLCQLNNKSIGRRVLGRSSNIPPVLAHMLSQWKVVKKPSLETSKDQMISYAYLPICDVSGRTVATLVDSCRRDNLVAYIHVIRQMSFILTMLCAAVSIVGLTYSRNRSLAIRAHKDELTGLFNHGYLQERLKEEVIRAERYERPLSVLMLDIDHFKVVNDSYGHSIGDQALKSVSETVLAAVRDMDFVARYGGEEFVVVLPETEFKQAIACAERIRRAVEVRAIHAKCTDKGAPTYADLHITVSLGVASFPGDAQSPADLIVAADTALAGAKRTRNAVFAYQDMLDDQHSGNSRLVSLDGFLRDSSISTVRPLVAAIDTRDPGSAYHSEKTAEYAVAIGVELGFSTQDLSLTCKAALLHDVGKIGISDLILTKDGKLSLDEMEIVKGHSAVGADILAKSPQLAPVAVLVLHHHERYDGKGYPDGLTGNKIPLISRVLAVADTLDAMTSQRSYHTPASFKEAIEELQRLAGTQFDPDVVEATTRVVRRIIRQQDNHRQAA